MFCGGIIKISGAVGVLVPEEAEDEAARVEMVDS
jgi:hypothetical protein